MSHTPQEPTQGQPNGNPPSDQPYPQNPPTGYQQPGQPYPQGQQNFYQQYPEKERNTLGLIAFIASIVGFVFACIPGAFVIGWILLPIAFVLGIISLFLKNKKLWMGITAIVVSVVGFVVGVVVFLVVVAVAVDQSISESSASASAAASAPARAGETTGHFGDQYEFDDGLAVSVSEPKEFKPSDTAAIGSSSGEGTPEKFTVTIHNGSDKAFDVSGFSTSAQSGGSQADSIFDSKSNLSFPTGKIQPGKDLTFDIGYRVKNPKDISMDVRFIGDGANFSEVSFVS